MPISSATIVLRKGQPARVSDLVGGRILLGPFLKAIQCESLALSISRKLNAERHML
jgi:hypothetical protein